MPDQLLYSIKADTQGVPQFRVEADMQLRTHTILHYNTLYKYKQLHEM